MKALIVEDEWLLAQQLKKNLHLLRADIEVLATLDSVNDAVAFLKKTTPDLLFLDIQLSDGLSFSIFDQVDVTVPVIFTTAYDQYAIKAFETYSIAYLLKPIEKDDLLRALKKFDETRELFQANEQPDYQALLSAIQGESAYLKRFMGSKGRVLKPILTEEVAYFRVEGKYVLVFTQSEERYFCDFTLGQLEEKLDPGLFFRINRKYLVYYQSIVELYSYSKSRLKVVLKPTPPEDEDIVISTEKARDFKAWINQM
ncbi:MAG: LytTR family DNA-binding domain-containing protein [Bacteroidales bacterium]